MALNFVGGDRGQLLLMPPSLTEWLPEDHLVWTVLGALDPEVMGIASARAIPKAWERAGLAPEQIDLWEVHEAYTSVAVAILRELPKQLDGYYVR